MPRKPAKSKPSRSEAVKIVLEHIPAPDAEDRLSRAYRLALAARAESEAAEGSAAAQNSRGGEPADDGEVKRG
ncbi:MAG: hypothetical protein V1724_08300 [Chloroflexota bacterium]